MRAGLAEARAVPRRAPAARRAAAPGAGRSRASITAVAFSGIAALVLILVFVAQGGAAALLRPRGADEVSARQAVPAPGDCGRAARPAFIWQPVVERPEGQHDSAVRRHAEGRPWSRCWSRCRWASRAALFASEFAPRRLREMLKPAIELLAGIPSVVLGFFALMVLATLAAGRLRPHLPAQRAGGRAGAGAGDRPGDLHRRRGRAHRGAAQLPRGVAGARAPPAGRRPGGWCCPRPPPASSPACVLGFGRAIGETMIVLMASGNAAIVSLDLDATRCARCRPPSPRRWARWWSAARTTRCSSSSASMLFVFTFVLNLLAGALDVEAACCRRLHRERRREATRTRRSGRRRLHRRSPGSPRCCIVAMLAVILWRRRSAAAPATLTLGVPLPAPRRRDDRRRHLPRDLRHGGADAADDARGDAGGRDHRHLPARVRAARLAAGARGCGWRSATWPACRRSSSASSAWASSSSSSAAAWTRLLGDQELYWGQPRSSGPRSPWRC